MIPFEEKRHVFLFLRDLAAFSGLKIFPALSGAIGLHGVFALHGLISLLGCALVGFAVPETRGKSMSEIEELFKESDMNACQGNEDAELMVENDESNPKV